MNLLKSLRRLGGRERGLAELAKWLALPEAELRPWLSSAPAWTRGFDYTRFTIPKRRGGTRTIDAPGDTLKALQRRVLARLLSGLKLSRAATGFARGRSIVDNARPHTNRAVVINLDLADFFPSITEDRVLAVWRGLGWNADAATILTHICTLDGRLPQGAPTSPALSNLVCRRLDARLLELAMVLDGDYTRYADDLTFSLPSLGRNKRRRIGPARSGPGPRPARPYRRPAHSRKILTMLREIIEAEGFKIQFKKKVRLQRPHQRQTATGLVVNQVVNLPRVTRRLIRAMQHRQRLHQLDEAGQRRLQGLENLQKMVIKQRNASGR
jgi:RNA-directed DNA polymerase